MKKISITALLFFALTAVKAQDATTVKNEVKKTATTKKAEGTQKGKSAVSTKTAVAGHTETTPAPVQQAVITPAPVDVPKTPAQTEGTVIPAGTIVAPK